MVSAIWNKSRSFSLPSFATDVIDATGTGDALLAYATLSMLISKNLVISSIIGSMAAACECESDGNITISTNQILEKINNLESSTKYSQ